MQKQDSAVLNFYVANNFGPSSVSIFSTLTQILVDCANAMNDANIVLMSETFQFNLIRTSDKFLLKYYPNHKFEYFFQQVNGECFFIVNDIYKHPNLNTASGKHIHDAFMLQVKNQ
jgi:hypothetical protein